jgi:hypothetical protein
MSESSAVPPTAARTDDTSADQPLANQNPPAPASSSPHGLKAYAKPTIARHGNLRMMTQLE